MSTHNLCFEQKFEKYQSFLSENFQFLEVKFSIYLNRRVFVMTLNGKTLLHSPTPATHTHPNPTPLPLGATSLPPD